MQLYLPLRPMLLPLWKYRNEVLLPLVSRYWLNPGRIKTQEESQKRLLTYLAGCQENYRPSNIDTLNERVQDYKTNEQKLKDKMKELEADQKRQEE